MGALKSLPIWVGDIILVIGLLAYFCSIKLWKYNNYTKAYIEGSAIENKKFLAIYDDSGDSLSTRYPIYRYYVNNKLYIGVGDIAWEKKKLSKSLGTSIEIYYNPNKPELSTMYKYCPYRVTSIFIVFIGLAVCFSGLVVILLWGLGRLFGLI